MQHVDQPVADPGRICAVGVDGYDELGGGLGLHVLRGEGERVGLALA